MSASPKTQVDGLTARMVEDLAMLLADAGMPRMSARVYAYLVVDGTGPRTAGELAAGLSVSPAAVSGAVRHLVQFGVLDKSREPGANADSYDVRDDATDVLMRELERALRRAAGILSHGIDALEMTGQEAGPKLVEAREYLRFWADEVPGLLGRWEKRRRSVLSARSR